MRLTLEAFTTCSVSDILYWLLNLLVEEVPNANDSASSQGLQKAAPQGANHDETQDRRPGQPTIGTQLNF